MMFRTRQYRYGYEHLVLVMTLILVLGVIILTSTVTFCLSGVFIIVMFIISALMIRSHHQSLMRDTIIVNSTHTPELARLASESSKKLQPGAVDVFLADKMQLNAYTFGLGSPKALVLFTPLLRVMNSDELRFIIGHEMGHVALGHTWLNTIVGGLAGIPAPFGAAVLLYAAFRWWNRMCEFSADRAGLLACGDLNRAISALVKLVAPDIRSQHEFERALAMIDAEDDAVSNRLASVFQSHPMLIRRINQLRDYSHTAEYQRLQAGVNRNIRGQPRQSSQSDVLAKRQISPSTQIEKSQKSPEERWPWLKPIDKK